MEAVIMAAGLGTRLRPYTEQTPKPLLRVQGKPILDWTLQALPLSIQRIIVVIHYLGEQIEEYLQQQKHFSDWKTVRQEVPRGTGDAFRSCRECLQTDRILVMNGDDLYGAADLAQLVEHPAAMLVHPVSQPRQFGIAFAKPDGTLDRLVEKPDLDGRQLANTGVYVFPKEVFDIELKLSPRGEYEITDYVSQLATRRPVQLVTAEFWRPIGSIEAWRAAEEMDLKSKISKQRSAIRKLV